MQRGVLLVPHQRADQHDGNDLAGLEDDLPEWSPHKGASLQTPPRYSSCVAWNATRACLTGNTHLCRVVQVQEAEVGEPARGFNQTQATATITAGTVRGEQQPLACNIHTDTGTTLTLTPPHIQYGDVPHCRTTGRCCGVVLPHRRSHARTRIHTHRATTSGQTQHVLAGLRWCVVK